MESKVLSLDGQLVVSIPEKCLQELGLQEGSSVRVRLNRKCKRLEILSADVSSQTAPKSSRFRDSSPTEAYIDCE